MLYALYFILYSLVEYLAVEAIAGFQEASSLYVRVTTLEEHERLLFAYFGFVARAGSEILGSYARFVLSALVIAIISFGQRVLAKQQCKQQHTIIIFQGGSVPSYLGVGGD